MKIIKNKKFRRRKKQKNIVKLFPSSFMWGASTASHQVEGGNHNQWTVWELENAARLSRTAKKRLSWLPDWPQIEDKARDPKNYVSGRGVDHYRRYKQDFKLLKKLNLNTFRFGIEWSRIEPEEGQWNEKEIEHYRNYIDELLAQDIIPVLNIWHWTLPVWFTDKGGFVRGENLVYFDRFVDKIGEEYGDKLRYILTLNETNVYTAFSYLSGEWPPGDKSWVKFLKVYWNLSRAHNRSYKILKTHNSKLQIGIAAHLVNIKPKRPHNLIDVAMTKWMRYFWNWWFLNRVKRHQDFIGINYYFTDYYMGAKTKNPKVPLSDMGWYMEPEGVYTLLVRLWTRYKKPIIITENGVADSEDRYRRWWLEQTMVAMERAISEGVDLRGYFYWSLLDNFEWAYGWWPNFGLIDINMRNMKRKIRPSAKWWADWIEETKKKNLPDL